MKQISALELKRLMDLGEAPQLLDVRETREREAFTIGGLHVPMSELLEHLDKIPREEALIVYCEKGIRSTIVIQRLQAMGFNQLINLSGGMKAWKTTE
jgi:rhodanese-related sulfurtransferase